MLDKREYKRLSKTIAHALRHAPTRYGLTLDTAGWADLETLIAALRQHRAAWSEVTAHDITQMIATSDKKRYEIKDDRIRAYYGHSIDDTIEHEYAEPPEFLYHGTKARTLDAILSEGLQPMNRQHVHLSTDQETAADVGERRRGRTVLLTIRAREAHQNGIRFHHGNEAVWLSEAIPAHYIIAAPQFEAAAE